MNNRSFNFWYKWLLVVSILNLLMGLLIAFSPDSFLFSFHTEAIAEIFFGGNMPKEANGLRSFLFGIIGGTIAGYFLLQTLIVWIPFYRHEPWAWHAILWAMLLWFAVDSSMSIYHGAFFNVWMINLWSLLLTGIALVMTYPAFQHQRKCSDEIGNRRVVIDNTYFF